MEDYIHIIYTMNLTLTNQKNKKNGHHKDLEMSDIYLDQE